MSSIPLSEHCYETKSVPLQFKEIEHIIDNPKKLKTKVNQLVSVDINLWKEFKELKSPFGTVNEMFEDYILILLGRKPKHKETLLRLIEVTKLIEV